MIIMIFKAKHLKFFEVDRRRIQKQGIPETKVNDVHFNVRNTRTLPVNYFGHCLYCILYHHNNPTIFR